MGTHVNKHIIIMIIVLIDIYANYDTDLRCFLIAKFRYVLLSVV